ncbi:S8 family serine peptidase [Dehalococcoides mccartyi]|uniref:S8 family serine peptidase n=1 Tax=Dehalococcoides mccartyi TaxID=61435 RepID=UPI001A051277|nr:S8 family serine peptidase [Dehalococcoides mccartyi]MBF4483097.1 S8 family serine peptidase [Dehalococcoides mccartyi]MBJ7531730.1 S8 family serine peptidase [Dehalococcoides mccartyi]
MADSDTPTVDRLPIKLIMPKQGKEKKVPAGGTPPRPFRVVDDAYRKRLSNEVSAISEAVLPQVRQRVAIPLRVKILTKAVAKSHRPEQLFSSKTCPIVGAGRLGELFVKATAGGLENLTRTIESDRSQQVEKELSSVELIEAITPSYRRKGVESGDVLRRSPRGKNGFITRVRLFNFGEDNEQASLVTEFEEVCRKRDIRINTAGYSPDSFVYGAECHSVDDVDALSRIVGVRSVSSMPLIRTLHPTMFNPKPLPKLLTRQDISGDVPVVVVVDTGITDRIPELNTWVVGRESQVAPAYRNTDHGTFVAGLICWGSNLNPTISNIDASPCAVFDFQVLPNDDPGKGPIESIQEQEFLVSIDTALRQHANEYKVWNLSLSTDETCSLDEFSEFAEELDNLQEKYQVSFVISAGNFSSPPLLDYPRKKSQMDPGRITVPSDSVLGISIGSISHVDYMKNGPKMHEPSAFSRHGAGPNYVIKPDLVHYGGACSLDASHISGVRSLNGKGSAENLGTSFAAPLVSRILAQIYHQITPTPQPVLARALLTHHARDPRTHGRVPDGEENFFGFGLPSPLPYCLECTPFTSTLVFDDVLRPGYFLEWDDFPYPPSLQRDGRYFGEIWMTVAFAPERGARWGSEYCETHIDAHFGVYRDRVSRETGEITSVFTGLVPPEHKNPGVLYESYQVEKLRKWAPVRTYYGNLGKDGERGNRWRLMVKLLTRHGVEDTESFKPQPFSLIITISDPEKKAPVYDDMARVVRNRFQAQNLALRATARIRGRS